jgi:hypothetical protein
LWSWWIRRMRSRRRQRRVGLVCAHDAGLRVLADADELLAVWDGQSAPRGIG